MSAADLQQVMTSGPPYLVVAAGVIACWLLFRVALIGKPKASAPEKSRDRTSQAGIGLQAMAFALAWSRFWFPATRAVPSHMGWGISLTALGLALASAILSALGIRTLGKQWALTARVLQDHKLVTSGPYALVRNPIYTGMYGMLIATGILFGAWPLVVVAVVLYYIGAMIRIRAEERLLRAQFGAEFDEYAARVPALLPVRWPAARKPA